MNVIAVEIGGTKQQAALGNTQGEISELRSVRLGENTNPPAILSWLEENISQLLKIHSAEAISIGYGGPVDLNSGSVICSMQVDGWAGIPLEQHFRDIFSLPCRVLNDSDCAGLGELRCGAGRGSKKMLYTNIGTGIGGSVLIDGKLYTGSGRGAGELGHTWTYDFRSGKMARLESICCGPAIEKALNSPGYVPPSSSLSPILESGGYVSCADLGKAAAAGDGFAVGELGLIADSFACALSNALSLLAPDCVVIGGGLANLGELFIAPIRERLKDYVYPPFAGFYEVKSSLLLDRAVIVGALAAAGEA